MARLSVVPSCGLIEPSSPVPLYFQIANIIQARIFAGTLQAGAPIGTEKELAEEFGVSRITVRKALEVLRADGLLKIERGRGSFVAESPTSSCADGIAPVPGRHHRARRNARGGPRRTDGRRGRTAVAQALRVRAGTKVVRVRQHMRPTDGQAARTGHLVDLFSYSTHLAPAVANCGAARCWNRLDRAPGLRLAQGHEIIEADQRPTPKRQSGSKYRSGRAILRRQREYQTASGRTVVFGWVDRTTGAIPVLLSRTER